MAPAAADAPCVVCVTEVPLENKSFASGARVGVSSPKIPRERSVSGVSSLCDLGATPDWAIIEMDPAIRRRKLTIDKIWKDGKRELNCKIKSLS
jgi:hypothetical protein